MRVPTHALVVFAILCASACSDDVGRGEPTPGGSGGSSETEGDGDDGGVADESTGDGVDGDSDSDADDADGDESAGDTAGEGAVTVVFPPDGALSSERTVVVRGQATGAASVVVAGVEAQTESGFAQWRAEVPLTQGDNELMIEAELVGGGTEVDTLHIEHQPMLSRPVDIVMDEDTIFVLDAARPGIVAFDKGSGARSLLTDDGSDGPTLVDPRAMEILDDGTLVVADVGQALRIDPATGDRSLIASSGTVAFDDPVGLYVDELYDRTLILDGDTTNVVEIDEAGTVSNFSTSADGVVLHDVIAAVTRSVGWEMFVLDFDDTTGQHFLVEIDMNTGQRTLVTEVHGMNPGTTRKSIAYDPFAGNMYVLDGGQNISRFPVDTGVAIGYHFPAAYANREGAAIEFDPLEGIIIADSGRDLINRLDPEAWEDGPLGGFDFPAEGALTPEDPRSMASVADGAYVFQTQTLVHFGVDGESTVALEGADLSGPIVAEPDGSAVYILNSYIEQSVQKFDVATGVLTTLTQAISTPNSGGYLAAVDPMRDRILVVDQFDTLLAVDTETGTTTELGMPDAYGSLAVDAEGTIFTVAGADLHTVDPTTGAHTQLIEQLPQFGFGSNELVALPDGRLMMLNASADRLIFIDPYTEEMNLLPMGAVRAGLAAPIPGEAYVFTAAAVADNNNYLGVLAALDPVTGASVILRK